MKRKGSVLLIIVVIIALTLVFVFINKRNTDQLVEAANMQQDLPVYKPPVDSFPYLYKKFSILKVADSSRVFLLEGSKVNLDSAKYIALADGDMIFEIHRKDLPFVVNTRILQLTVLKAGVFRVEAYHKDNGEKVDVLEGVVRAKKRYESQFPEPDTVRKAEMVMINDQIDLMEKEKEDLTEFAKWWNSLK